MRSYSQPQMQMPQSPFQIQPMFPPSQQMQNGHVQQWNELVQQQEQRQYEQYLQGKQHDQQRKQRYREMLDQDVQNKQQKKMIEKQVDIDNQKYWNDNEQVISDMLSKQKNVQKLYFQKLSEENLILAQQRQDQVYNSINNESQYQTMDERMNQFRLKEAQVYQRNQNKMQQEFLKIQQINQQNQQLLEGQKITPVFPHQNIIRGSHNILNVERKNLHDRCDDVVYEQIKQKQALKAKERGDKLRERELIEMQAKYLEEQEKQQKEKKKYQYQQYSSDNNIQCQSQKQLQLRENQMNERESALNSQKSKNRDKNGIELNPIYSLEYNSYERQKQLSQVDRALSRQMSPNSINQLNQNRIQSHNNLNQVNSGNMNNQPSSTLARNGSQLINNDIPINHQSAVFSQNPWVQSNQKFMNKLQKHADNFNQIRVLNPQSLQNPQVNFNGAQLLHKNIQQESNFIKDTFGINSNHGYNIVSGHILSN